MRLPSIQPGDTIAIVSPASAIEAEAMQGATERLRQEGYKLKFGKNVLAAHHYLAGTDEQRRADLEWAFADPDVGAVLCARGGFGTQRLLRHLDLDGICYSGKLFLGFSDITSLHLAFNAGGLATVYAPMMGTLSKPREPWVWESFLSVLRGNLATPKAAPRATKVVGGSAGGVVTGACLTLVADSLGTPYAVRGEGRILLLEDVGEQGYRIDASMTHLWNAGVLDGLAGVVIGEMTDTDKDATDASKTRPWQEIVLERLLPLGIPIVIDFPFGHIDNMLTLALGIEATLDADEGTLTYTQA